MSVSNQQTCVKWNIFKGKVQEFPKSVLSNNIRLKSSKSVKKKFPIFQKLVLPVLCVSPDTVYLLSSSEGIVSECSELNFILLGFYCGRYPLDLVDMDGWSLTSASVKSHFEEILLANMNRRNVCIKKNICQCSFVILTFALG